MSLTPRERMAASVRQRLFNLAKARDEDFNLALTRYALERFLYRLSLSPHKNSLVLKGAMLFQLWAPLPHRSTRDMDFLSAEAEDPTAIAAMVSEICKTQTEEDGLEFDLSKLTVVEIREDNHYGGVRARFGAKLGSAKIKVQLDFGFGDAVTPPPSEAAYPTLLAMSSPQVLTYPRETVIAEKLEAIVDLGLENSRMKDYFD